MPARTSIIGLRFARLKIIADAPDRIDGRGRHARMCVCLCDCGNQATLRYGDLYTGNTKSCGCYRIGKCIEDHFIHGHAFSSGNSRTYRSWRHMIERCTKPNDKAWKNYGGRGITVCDRWHVFTNFLEDMGECPSGKMIDRINNDGNYEPGNVRWSTSKEQNRNRRFCHMVTVDGITACLSETCERLNIPLSRVKARIAMGWPDSILFTPSRR